MVKLVFVEHEGAVHTIEAPAGSTLMEAARRKSVPGIDAECGGACACATCHVYVDTLWVNRLPPRGEDEENLLEMAFDPDPVYSRLSCQIKLTDEMEGLTVRIPETQM